MKNHPKIFLKLKILINIKKIIIIKRYYKTVNEIKYITTENKNYKDGCDWRCAKKGTNKHDNKFNIRYKRIFANTKTDIPILYYII